MENNVGHHYWCREYSFNPTSLKVSHKRSTAFLLVILRSFVCTTGNLLCVTACRSTRGVKRCCLRLVAVKIATVLFLVKATGITVLKEKFYVAAHSITSTQLGFYRPLHTASSGAESEFPAAATFVSEEIQCTMGNFQHTVPQEMCTVPEEFSDVKNSQ